MSKTEIILEKQNVVSEYQLTTSMDWRITTVLEELIGIHLSCQLLAMVTYPFSRYNKICFGWHYTVSIWFTNWNPKIVHGIAQQDTR